MHDNPHSSHLAVIYIPFDIANEMTTGETTDFLRQLVPFVPGVNATSARVPIPPGLPDVKSLISKLFVDGYAFYEGSVTHPPCSEQVTWIIPSRKAVASEDDIRVFASLLNHNNRYASNDGSSKQF
jgi:carbonic anhydrase